MKNIKDIEPFFWVLLVAAAIMVVIAVKVAYGY